MTRRRRALALIGLAIVLGTLAGSDVARREAALTARIGPGTSVLVARADLEAGHRLTLGDLALREVPARYAPPGAAALPGALAGRELAVPVRRGAALAPELLVASGEGSSTAVRVGERAALVTGTGSPEDVAAGARVDVLVTSEGRDGAAGGTRLALEDVEVLAAAAATRRADAAGDAADASAPQVTATLRVTLRQAVALAAAQAFSREIRLLARPPGDDARAGAVAAAASGLSDPGGAGGSR
jgi:pilus assembly protein CpaB